MPKLFITGSTGYIGGDVLHTVAKAYPELDITALARNSDKGANIASQYSKVKLVYGDLDSTELLKSEASKADIIIHTANCDHVASAEALVDGLVSKPEGSKSWLIHTSGTGILCWADLDRKSYGVKNEKVFDDWDGIAEVTSIPDHAVHRNVDKVILGASKKSSNISTAIVCPPCIYGPGRGPDNRDSVQAYRMAAATLKRGRGFHVGEGQNLWTEVHVQDLSNVFLGLVTAALDGGGNATWNENGYYFAENGDLAWGDIGKTIAKAAKKQGLLETDEVDHVSPEEADKLTNAGSYLWGMNSRARAIRARKVLEWKPTQESLENLIPEIVEGEARRIGLVKGHAEKAAGAS